ncbi:MAG: hypothetical protein E7350_00145 [Clostridiales bacterium]|nr:hypothetical protein [Clostridiales bacterium]
MENEKLITNEDDIESTQNVIEEESFTEHDNSVKDDFDVESTEEPEEESEEDSFWATKEEAEEEPTEEPEEESEEDSFWATKEDTEDESTEEPEEESEEDSFWATKEDTEEEPTEEPEEESEEDSFWATKEDTEDESIEEPEEESEEDSFWATKEEVEDESTEGTEEDTEDEEQTEEESAQESLEEEELEEDEGEHEEQSYSNASTVIPMANEVEKKEEKSTGKKQRVDKKTRKERKEEKKRNKKRRGCCFNCCMSILVFNFVMMCVLVGVGWVYGNQLARDNLDMSIGEVYGVVLGLTRSNGDFIDNAYGEADEEGFYDSIGSSLLLKDEALSAAELKDAVIQSATGEETYVPLESFLVNLLVAENFDQDKIRTIGTENQADTNLKISDRELAAFIDGMLSSLIQIAMEAQINEGELMEFIDLSMLSPAEYLKLDQLKIYPQQVEIDGVITNVDKATVTASINFETLFEDIKEAVDVSSMVIDSQDAPEGVLNAAEMMFNYGVNLISKILPKTFYVTVDMGISHNIAPTLYINNMGMDNERMNNFYKLLAKAGVDVQGMLNEMFVSEEGAIASAMNTIKEIIPLEDILTNGGVDCDIYQLIIDIAKLNEAKDGTGNLKPEAERISTNDILSTLKLVLLDNSDYLDDLKSSEYSYKNVQFARNEDGSLDLSGGEPVIVNQDKQYYVTTKEELDTLIADYEQLFLSRFANSYGLDTNRYNDMDSIIEVFSGESFDADAVIDMFDSDKLKSIISGEAKGLVINDKMLAALFAKMLPSFLEQGEIDKGAVGAEFIYLEKREDDHRQEHFMLNVGLNIDIHRLIDTLMSSDEVTRNFIKNIITQTVIIEAGIDITPVATDTFEYLPTEIKYNGNGISSVEKLLGVFDALGTDEDGNAILLGDLIGEMLSPIRETISNLDTTLPGMTMEESAIKLPNVYVALAKAINGDTAENEAEYIQPEKIENVLKLFVNADPFADANSEYYFYRADNAEEVNSYNQQAEIELLRQLQNKYGLCKTMVDTDYEYTLDDVLYVLLGLGSPSDSRVEGVELYDLIDTSSLEALAFDDSADWMQSQRVQLLTHVSDYSHPDMLTALIKRVVNFDDLAGSMGEGVFTEDNLLYVSISEDELGNEYLSVTVSVVVADILATGDGENAMMSFMSDLLDGSAVITLSVNLTDETAQTETIINGNAGATSDLFDLLDTMGVDFDMSQIASSVRSAYNSLAEQIDVELDAADNKMLLPTMFTLINDVVLGENALEDGVEADRIVTGEEKLKLALKGVFTTSNTVPEGETASRISAFEASLEGISPNTDEDGNPDYSSFIQEEVTTKYFLNESATSQVSTFDELFEVIDVTNLHANDIFNIDGDGVEKPIGLAYTTKELYELNPIITVGNLGAILVSNLQPSDGDEDGLLAKIAVHSMHISLDEHDKAHLTINAALPLGNVLDGANDDMARLLTVDTVYVTITVDIEGEVYGNDEDGHYYDCSIVINGMNEYEQGYLLDLADAFGGNLNTSEMQAEVGKAIYSAMSKLEHSLGGGNFDFTAEGVKLCDVFTFIETNVLSDDNSTDKPTADEVREVIQGMYAAKADIDNPWNFKESDIVVNPILAAADNGWETEALVTHLVEGGSVTDAELGAYIASKYDNDESELDQFSLLAANATLNSNNAAERQRINVLLEDNITHIYPHGDLHANTNYIILTAEINVDEMIGSTTINSTIDELIDDHIFITLIIDFDKFINNEEDFFAGFIINNLGCHLFDIFAKLTGVDYETIMHNLESVSQDLMGPIHNLMGDIEELASAAGSLGHTVEVSYKITEYAGTESCRGEFGCNVIYS